MLILTHIWIMRLLPGLEEAAAETPELVVHNVSPDILPIHKDITTAMTHSVGRFLLLPCEHRKARLVQFHLMVDDIAHYGRVRKASTTWFDAQSEGYTYQKGRMLVEPIREFYRGIDLQISIEEALYCSHILIEMAVDQALQERETYSEILPLFLNSFRDTLENKMDDFCNTTSWIYSIHKETIADALRQGSEKLNHDAMEILATPDGRISLYIDKFGLDGNDEATWEGVQDLLLQGVHIVSDYDTFLRQSIRTIGDAGFTLSS